MRIKSFVYLLIATMIIAACDDDNKIGNDIENKFLCLKSQRNVQHLRMQAPGRSRGFRTPCRYGSPSVFFIV